MYGRIRCNKKNSEKLHLGKEGLETFRAKIDIQIMNRNGYYENETRKKHLLSKHDIMLRYYEKTFGDF